MNSRCFLAVMIAGLLGSGAAFAGASDPEPNDSLVAPEVQDIDDPFRRGIDRIADQATGGVELPSPSGNIWATQAFQSNASSNLAP